MTRRLALALTTTLALAASPLLGQDQSPIYRSGVSLVSVSASVRSRDLPVIGLTASDFELLDNGVAQKIEAFSSERQPIDVTLLLDVSQSVDGALLDRLKAAVRQTAALLDGRDRLRVIAMQQQLTEIVPWEPGGAVPPVDGLQGRGGTALYDGLVAAMVRPDDIDRRQLIVALTDGKDTMSITPMATASDVALHTDAVVHLVAVAPKGQPRLAAPLRAIALDTGGQVFALAPAQAIGDAFARATDDFRMSYVLRYTPTGVPAKGWHTVTVRLKNKPFAEVRARKGYDGGSP